MRTKNKNLTATMLGVSMLLAACSGSTDTPNALAFQDDSSGGAEAAEAVTVNRPTGNPCASNDYSVAFDESVVLLDPDVIMAGDFAVNVPAGTYDITVSTWFGFEDIPAQTMEQWYFTTDSGYTSPTTDDPSPELVWNQTFENQTLADTTSVKLFHKAPGMDSVNSVHPLCIGFRSVAAPVVEETTTTTAAPVVEETTTTAAPPVEETTTTTAAPVVEEPTTTEAEAPVVDETTTTTAAPVEETTTTTEAPAVGAGSLRAPQGPELALTGPSELATSLGLTGAALVLAGSAAVVAARRSEDD